MRLKHFALAVVVFAGLLSACGKEATPLNVVARDYGFSGVGKTITGGAVKVTFTNKGQATHELQFLDIGNTSLDSFTKKFAPAMQGGPIGSFLKRATGAGELEPGKSKTTTITLPKGNWKLFCALDDAPGEGDKTVKPHYTLGMWQDVKVEGPESVELEPTGGTFHAKDYTFVPPSELVAGKNTFAFVNDGPDQLHFMYMAVFPKGTSAAQAEAAFGKLLKLPEDKPPPAGVPTPDDVLDTAVFSAGMGQTFTATLQAGRTYLAACFLQDRAGGPPHAIAHHMYKAFTVPA